MAQHADILVASVPEQVIGYDARDYRDDLTTRWPKSRKEEFLYRHDVRKVLSVDTMVWPSVFAALEKPAPPHQESIGDLWASESNLAKTLSQRSAVEMLPPFRTVAITLVLSQASSHPLAAQLGGFVEPPRNSSDWQFVGFDVADTFLLSALANCGFLPGFDDPATLRRDWAPHLNEFHLFPQLAAADAFRQMSDIRLANDHAPTFVYGIHLLKLPQ